MPDAYTEFKGSLLRLSDERFIDFVADVEIVRAIHESNGLGESGLRQHADELREISGELETRVLDGEQNTNTLWRTVVGLAIAGADDGKSLIDAHAYVRTYRLIDAEFGPDETKTTHILRDLSLGRIACCIEDAPKRNVIDFFDSKFSTELMGVFWGSDGRVPNKLIEQRLFEAEEKGEVNDPALARVVSTLIARSCDVLYEIDEDYRAELLHANRNIFADRGMFSKGAKEVPSLLVDSKDDETEAIDQIEGNDTGDNEETEKDDEFNIEGVMVKLNRSAANCRVDRADFRSRRLYERKRNYFVSIMFPNRGEDINAAKDLCGGCEIREDCLEYALQNNIATGIWGGESERTRRKMRTARKKQQEQLQAVFKFMTARYASLEPTD